MAPISRGILFFLLMSMVSCALFGPHVSAQSPVSQGNDNQIHAPWVSCFDQTGEHFIGPKSQRTPVLTSPNRAYHAYAEIRAERIGAEECANTSELFVSTRGATFKSVFTQAPSDLYATAGSLGPVAWSPNSRWLAVEQGLWFYGSDAGAIGLLLYDSRLGKTSTPDVDGLIQRAVAKRCVLRYAVLGFDAQNLVRLRVRHSFDEEGERESNCFSGAVDWLLDPASLTVRSAQATK